MIKMSVMYPNEAGSTFDMAYYLNTHIPLVRERFGSALKGTAVDQGLAGGQPGTAPAYLAICHLMFDSVEASQKCFGEHGKEIRGDVPNYTNTRPTVQLSEVKI